MLLFTVIFLIFTSITTYGSAHRRRCFLETLEQIHHLGLLFNVLYFLQRDSVYLFNNFFIARIYIKLVEKTYLNDIQASSTSPSHIDGDRFDQCTLGKVLDLLRHCSTVEQGLSLSLSCSCKLQN